MITPRLIERVKADEGFRARPYTCSANKLTIGWGRNLSDNGISEAEALVMLQNDLGDAYDDLVQHWPPFLVLDQIRQEALLNLVFNIGITRFMGFRKMRSALEQHDYTLAAKELLNSKYAQQVGMRAQRLSRMIDTGEAA